MVQGLITIQVRVDTHFHFLFCPLQLLFWLCFCLKCKKEHICLFLCVSVVFAYICVHPLCVFVCAHVLWIFMHSWACMYIYVISAHLHGYSGLSSCFLLLLNEGLLVALFCWVQSSDSVVCSGTKCCLYVSVWSNILYFLSIRKFLVVYWECFSSGLMQQLICQMVSDGF